KEGATPGGTKVVEIGPLPPISASEYLLRVNRAGGAPGAKTPIHTHPGPKAFYVLSGKLGQKTPHGVAYAEAGTTMIGHGATIPAPVGVPRYRDRRRGLCDRGIAARLKTLASL